MTLDSAAFRAAITGAQSHADLAALVETQVLDQQPFAFSTDQALYDSVRDHLATRLGADRSTISLVGSGALGYSIAPDNFSRPFHERSDLDFVVISPELFDEVWSVLLRWGHPIRHHVPPEAADWFAARSGEIFWGWLDPEQLRFSGVTRPSLVRNLRRMQNTWWETFRGLGTAFPDTQLTARHANARLYRSRMHLVHYQANGLRKVKRQLEENGT
jgi:hypothetical protein